MGAYDDVKTQGLVKCPNCGAKVEHMQTKDLDPAMDTYVLVPPLRKQKRTVRVYGSCDKCDEDVAFYFEEKNFKRLPRRKTNWKFLNRFMAKPKAKNKPRTVTAFIPNVDDKIYEKFKEKAAAEGLSEGEAFTKYAKAWLALKEKEDKKFEAEKKL